MPIVCVEDFEQQAKERVPGGVWDYIEGGAGAELSVSANREAFDRVMLRPRVLVDVSRIDTTTTVLGSPLRTPVIVAPTAYHGQVHPDAELATARGAGVAGSLFVATTLASRTIEAVAQAATGPLWFQLYWLRNRDVVGDLVTRAAVAGYSALVLTVDAPVIGRRLRDIRNAFAVDPGARAGSLEEALTAVAQPRQGVSGVAAAAAAIFDPTITWSDLAWLRSLSDLQLVLKGVMTAADATLAMEHRVDAIIASNHAAGSLTALWLARTRSPRWSMLSRDAAQCS